MDLVRRGLSPSRERAQVDIAAGRVLVAGAVADKPGRLVAPHEPVRVLDDGSRFVGRGGHKLDAALEVFDVDVAGRCALDAGASTGGFTDCLLSRGAVHVVAVDVGHGLLHERLVADPRVTVMERINVRHLKLDNLGPAAVPFPLVVADLAFISLTTVAPALLGLAAPGADLVLLVKPQFEAGRVEVSRGRGVITDPQVRTDAVDRVCAAYAGLGATIMGVMESPVAGAKGNIEFFVHLRAPAQA